MTYPPPQPSPARGEEGRFDPALLTGPQARALIRSGAWHGPTPSMARGWVQANLVVLAREYADDFSAFCERNPQACPLLEVTSAGSAEPARVAAGADLRLDLPRYRIYRRGALAEEVDDLRPFWTSTSVGFLLGCSYTFEAELLRVGIGLRHLDLRCVVPMYRTARPCVSAGPFRGTMVVSMRPIPAHLVERATEVTARFSRAHGAPIHVGDPGVLGIADLAQPDYGDAVPLYDGEVPVFWACGVTPQVAVEAARLDLMMTHAPGHMFITDLRDEDLTDPLPQT